MITPELVAYINKQLREGKAKEEIASALRGQGWPEADLNEAFGRMDLSFVPPVAVRPPLPSFSPPASQPSVRRTGLDSDLTDEEEAQIFKKDSSSSNFLDKKRLLIILLALGVSLVGGGAAAYFYYSQSPERIIAQMLEKSAQVKSEHYSGQADLELEVSGNSLLSSFLGGETPDSPPSGSPLSTKVILGLTTEFEMAADLKEPSHPRYFFVFNLVNKDEPAESRKPFFGLEMRGLDQVVYLKINELSGLGQDASGLVGQWVKIDPEEVASQMRQMGTAEKDVKEFEEAWKAPEISSEKMAELLKEFKVLKITAKLSGEKIDGQNTYHYKYVIEKEAVKKLIQEMDRLSGEKGWDEETRNDFFRSFDSLGSIEGEIWIGQKDLLPHKLTLKLEVKGEEKETKFAGRLQATVFLKNFNQPVDVQAPAQTKSLEEALGLVFQGLLGAKTIEDCVQKPASEKDQCYFDLALSSLERDDCQLIASLSKRNDCYYGVAKAAVNSLACEEMKGKGSQGWKDECYRAVAEIKPDSSLCQKVISLDWRNYCLAGAAKDPTFCSAIKKTSTKSACQALFAP
ncbi:MAG: hypothetical protein Q8N65_03360 [bacterium]|nr:hypothetical protein [bacterium]